MIKITTENGVIQEAIFGGEDLYNLHKIMRILFELGEDKIGSISFELAALTNNTMTLIAHPYFGKPHIDN